MLICNSISINFIHNARINYSGEDIKFVQLDFMGTLSPTDKVTNEMLKPYYDQLPSSTLTFELFKEAIINYVIFYYQVRHLLFNSRMSYFFEYSIYRNITIEENPESF